MKGSHSNTNNKDSSPKRIAHSYEDFAEEATILERQQRPWSQGAPGPNDPFPVQLHWMLEQSEKNGTPQVVSWAPHGRAFIVHQRDQFVGELLPVYFNQSKITSFQRQLSLYGFKRITKGPDAGGYYHPKFLRHSRIYARNIVRTKVKNDGPRKAASPEDEPDLYALPYVPRTVPMAGAEVEPISATGRASTPPCAEETKSQAQDNQVSSFNHLNQLNLTSLQYPLPTTSSSTIYPLRSDRSPNAGFVSNDNSIRSMGTTAANDSIGRILAQRMLERRQQEQNLGRLGAAYPPHQRRSWPNSVSDLLNAQNALTAPASASTSNTPSWLVGSINAGVGSPRSFARVAEINQQSMLLPPLADLRRFNTGNRLLGQLAGSNQTRGGSLTNEPSALSDAAVVCELMRARSHSVPPMRGESSGTYSSGLFGGRFSSHL